MKGAIERVEVQKVVKRFGATAALRGVDATFKAGAVSLIVGANGSGKSTLLCILGTTMQPSTGQVIYPPYEPGDVSVRAEIGWLSHDTLAYADLTGRHNIEIAAQFHGLDAKDAWARMEQRFELGSFATRPLRTNSRGQRQRVALARALVHDPSVVLLDEPTTGLDKAGVARLMAAVEERREQGAVVVVVAHDPELFASMSPTTLKLDRGRASLG